MAHSISRNGKAPLGYKLSDEVVKIEINDKGVFIDDNLVEEADGVYSFEFENEKIETPNTGDTRNNVLFIAIAVISIILLAIICIYSFIKRK